MRLLLLFALAACSAEAREHDRRENGFPAKVEPAPTGSLYNRIGRAYGVDRLVNSFVSAIAADQRIATFFLHVEVGRMKKLLNEQICAVSGGGCKYTGKDMKTAHAGMGVHAEHFKALIEDFTKAMVDIGLGAREQDELRIDLEAMRDDIVAP